MFGVPVRAPVAVLKLIPGGVALILKLAIAPPVELIVKPVAAVLTVLLSEDAERVNAGAASGGPKARTGRTRPALCLPLVNWPRVSKSWYHTRKENAPILDSDEVQ